MIDTQGLRLDSPVVRAFGLVPSSHMPFLGLSLLLVHVSRFVAPRSDRVHRSGAGELGNLFRPRDDRHDA
ncbi:hypothetical protein GG804_24805 [Sphingomonas histidinilytica]|uniref:hypothetical protein n=1 Tax=Sphingomonadales TaxID=204457 RepID=UPI000AB722BF|nr:MULTISPECIES: hypothetical protein [Sphingomonadaceae]MBO9379995.1 hypothetical protein [Rhizorhabdus histidinilytica]MCF8706671.1 hypothetical protein [Rhizorhapis sp. SPR117]